MDDFVAGARYFGLAAVIARFPFALWRLALRLGWEILFVASPTTLNMFPERRNLNAKAESTTELFRALHVCSPPVLQGL